MKTVYRYSITMIIVSAIGLLLLDKIVMPLYVREDAGRFLPAVTGMSFEEAKLTLELEGFVARRSDIKYTSAYSVGTVIDQYPDAMRKVKPGRTIHLTTAERERMVMIPDIIGKSIRSGRLKLSEVGLTVDSLISEFDVDIPMDVIRWQYPRAGDFLRRGSGLTVIISKGKPPDFYQVPQLFGLSLVKAEQLLTKLQLSLGSITYRQNEDLVPYTILEQSIVAGTVLGKPLPIDVTVSILDLNDVYNQLSDPKRKR